MFPRSNSSSLPLRRRKGGVGGGGGGLPVSIKTIAIIFLAVALCVYLVGFVVIVGGNNGSGRAGKSAVGGTSGSNILLFSPADHHLDNLAVQHMAGGHHEDERPPIRQPPDEEEEDEAAANAAAAAAADGGPGDLPHGNAAAVVAARHDNLEPTGITIGWAVTITGCGTDSIAEGAAVLKHAIHLASVHGGLGGRYDYKMYAIYHPQGETCAKSLETIGFELVRRDTPVQVEEIEGEFLRSKIHDNGCCGERELVKLEAYTLTQHPIVVHLDLDTVVLQPMDELFDWMLVDPEDAKTAYDTSDIAIMWPEKYKPQRVNAFFTRDYNMVGPTRKYKPVQGGFLILRPDMNVYNEFVDIIRKGNFTEGRGWGDVLGLFYGCMTFQGIIPYYYDVLHPNEAVELNRCVFNQMADNPKDKRTVNDIPQGRCRTNQEECEDCRNRPLEEVKTAHFTLCQKPWHCLPEDSDVIQQRLCRKLHHEWHRIRSDLEKSWGRNGNTHGQFQSDHFFGHCTKFGQQGYIPMKEPYGLP